MSADSPNHSRPELSAAMQNIITPQPVTDPTILDSVAGFINEVVPTTGGDTFDSKDQIQWARFENLDFDESNFSPTSDSALPSSLILVLGYITGVQVWAVPANGEAIELFSWRHGSVKVLRILPAPFEVGSSNKRDLFEAKRPLIALVDVAMHGSSAGSLNFYSLKTGEQAKQIKFKTQILDVVANRRSVIITFAERIAVFDACTLEDKLSVTSCYLSPGIQPNPVALGPRWLAFAEKKLVASRRSSGGNEGEGVQSYTATVLHAAKSLGRGLRELGDAVASSLTGNQGKLGTSPNSPQAGGSADVPQKGIVTILDVESPTTQNADGSLHPESIVAHFVAHTEAIVWLQFGPCGMLLLTADKRGHDFNLFRINPHPIGSALAAVHHLYTLHRGDTSARVQDMCFSFDSRWVTVSTLRGTTHVFPITPYGGNMGVRTHTTPHVVNKMSRFHRSAGLTSEGRSNSPVSMYESPVSSNFPYHNPRFSPFPHPTVSNPLAQLRQPVYMQNIGTTAPRQGRQRLTSSSEDNIALRVSAIFAPARAWIDSSAPTSRETSHNKAVKPVESLFVMNCHGTLVQYDLEPHHASSIPKERVCDDTAVELTVTAKAQWRLQRQPATIDRPLPLPHQNLMFVVSTIPAIKKKIENGNDDDWLSQVEIITHAGPHRRLWMGPQFTFKTYTTTNGTPMSLADAQPLDLNRSKPVNMPITKANAVLIESSSASSSEQSLLDIYRKNCEEMGAVGEHQIKEDLADAMIESPGAREAGGRCVLVSMKTPLTQQQRACATAPAPIAKVVNPLGTVVTVQSDDESAEPVVPEDIIIYENCDETLFRPLVSAKTVAYCRSSKADAGNIMTQSLRGDTNVTVRVMDKAEPGFSTTTNWEDPSTVQDIRNNTKVLVQEGEVRDLLAQRVIVEQAGAGGREDPKKKSRGKSKSDSLGSKPTKIVASNSNLLDEREISTNTPKTKSPVPERVLITKELPKWPIISESKQTPEKEAPAFAAPKVAASQSYSSSYTAETAAYQPESTKDLDEDNAKSNYTDKGGNSRSNIERDSSIKKNTAAKTKADKKPSKIGVVVEFDKPDFEESSFGLVNPLYNVLEEINSKRATADQKPEEQPPRVVNLPAAKVSRKSTKNRRPALPEPVAIETVDVTDYAVQEVTWKPDDAQFVDLGLEYSKEAERELDNEVESYSITSNNKTSSRSKRRGAKNEPAALVDDDVTSKPAGSVLRGLQSVEEISFPALDSKLTNAEFPPLEENFFSLENLAKADKYEDAEDCGLPLEPMETFFSDEPRVKGAAVDVEDLPQCELVSSDAVSPSEDNVLDESTEGKSKKASLRKPRKPKAKLGVKIGSFGKDDSPERSSLKESTPERSFVPEVSAEITLSVPKRSWSSIAAAKQAPQPAISYPWSNNHNNNNNNNEDDIPKVKDPVPMESYTITLPSKKHSYSTVSTEKLLDIDTPEERLDLSAAVDDDLLDMERSDRLSSLDKSAAADIAATGHSPDLLKLSDKSSDDEKNESGSSPVETTESSDEGKLRATVGLEDFDGKIGITANSAASKPSAKRRIRKKKK